MESGVGNVQAVRWDQLDRSSLVGQKEETFHQVENEQLVS